MVKKTKKQMMKMNKKINPNIRLPYSDDRFWKEEEESHNSYTNRGNCYICDEYTWICSGTGCCKECDE